MKITQFKRLAAMLLLVAAMVMPKMAWAQVTTTKPTNGDGTAANPYQIITAEELAWFRDFVNAGNKTACARLEADIDMSTVCHPADKNGVAELSWEPISKENTYWEGSFDGNNKTISNLYIKTSSTYSGLFGEILVLVDVNSSIKDIIFENVNITSTNEFSGVLAGFAEQTDISGITVNSGSINGTHYVGGIVGLSDYTNISNCVNRIPIVGSNDNIGGICGYAAVEMSITNCANYGDVKGSVNIGGIVGYIVNITLNNVFTSGNVTCGSTNPNCGLVVGYVNEKLTIQGHVLYNSDAKIFYDSAEQTVQTIGEKYYKATITGESNIVGLNSENLKTGEGAWMLNGQQSTGAWGQTLSGTGKQDYPVLGGLPVYYRDEVYTNTYGILTVGTNTITVSNEPPIWYEFTPEADGNYRFSSKTILGSICVNTEMTINNMQSMSYSPSYELSAKTTYYVYLYCAPGKYDLTIEKLNSTLKTGDNEIIVSTTGRLWYEFTPSETGSYQFSSTDLEGGSIYVVKDKNTTDDSRYIPYAPVYELTADNIYYVAVSDAPGTYALTIKKLDTTLEVGTNEFEVSAPRVWYEFTPTETGSYQFSSTQLTAGNLYVNTTKTESDYTDIATSPTYDLEAATTYYVAVNYAPGSYDLTITRLNNTPTAIEAVTAPQIYAVDGRIVCEGEFRIYDLLGRDVTRLNGSLNGVYVVKTANAAVKVVVK